MPLINMLSEIYPTALSDNLKIVQSGQTIQAVIDSITDAAADNPYTVMVPPGHESEGVVLSAYINLFYVSNQFDEIIKSASATLTASECKGTQISNYGQGAVNNLQALPTAAEGMNFTAQCGTAQAAHYFRFQAAASDKICLDGVAGSDNGYVEIAVPVVGATIQFYTFQTGASTWDWAAVSINGSWIAG